jgi:hypothetical protein
MSLSVINGSGAEFLPARATGFGADGQADDSRNRDAEFAQAVRVMTDQSVLALQAVEYQDTFTGSREW